MLTQYTEEKIGDLIAKLLVLTFKASILVTVFGYLPLMIGRQTGRWSLGHYNPPVIVTRFVDDDIVSEEVSWVLFWIIIWL